MNILQGWSTDEGNDSCVLYQTLGRRVGVNEDVLDSVCPEHDINDME